MSEKREGRDCEFRIHFCGILGKFDCMRNKSMLEWGYRRLTSIGIGETRREVCYNAYFTAAGWAAGKGCVMAAGRVLENDGEMGEK